MPQEVPVLEIPLVPMPSQSLHVMLGGQECTLRIYQRHMLPQRHSVLSLGRLYLDLDVGATRVVTGAVCQDRQHILQHAQALFRGRLAFVDTEGVDPPRWEGLGTRWLLSYEYAD